MAQPRLYEFNVSVTASAQPDAGTPTLPNDVLTLSYFTGIGTAKQEPLSGLVNGVNVTFTITQTPTSDDAFQLYQNGVLLRRVTHYTRAGTTITMVAAPVVGQDLDAVYRY